MTTGTPRRTAAYTTAIEMSGKGVVQVHDVGTFPTKQLADESHVLT